MSIVSFLLVVPAAFSQSEEQQEETTEDTVTYSFRVDNNSSGPVAYRCDGDPNWITIGPGSSNWNINCDKANLELHESPDTSLVAHDCSGGTREVTVTASALSGDLQYSTECL